MYCSHSQSGFTLIWLAVTLAVFGIILAGTLPGGESASDQAKTLLSLERMVRIEESTKGFMVQYGRRPCPADLEAENPSANFGMEAANPGTCSGGSPAANVVGSGSQSNIVAGGVPVATLALPAEYAIDGWGRRFVYAVDKRATETSSCFALQGNNIDPQTGITGDIDIKTTTSAGTSLGKAMWVLLSYGKDGHGSVPAQGGEMQNRRDTASMDADTINNAFGIVLSNPVVPAAFIRKERNDLFDDLVWTVAETGNTASSSRNRCCMAGSCGGGGGTSCTLPWGGTINSGQDVIAYQAETVPFGSPCVSETRLCTNGSLSGSYAFSACSVDPPADCNLSAEQGGGILDHGNSMDAYPEASVPFGNTCTNHTLSCANGTLSCSAGEGNCEYANCSVASPSDCTLPWGGTIAHTSSVTAYLNANEPYGSSCSDQTRTCNNGTLSGGYLNQSCSVDPPANCSLPWGGTLNHTDSVTAYQFAFVTSPASCASVSQIRTCTNGALSGSYTNESCYVAAGAGFKIYGRSAGDFTGTKLTSADVNNDGYEDVVIAAPYTDNNSRTDSGSVYILFGRANWPSLVDLADSANWNGTNGVRFDGATAGDRLGLGLGVGDVNGDGRADIIMGSPYADYNSRSDSGSVYLFFGRATGNWDATYDMSNSTHFNGTNGVRFDGAAAGDLLGLGSFAIGDTNGDAFADLLIGAPYADNNSRSDSGSGYLYFGKAAGSWNSIYDMSDTANFNGTTGARFDGHLALAYLGGSFAIGDTNGDGFGDVVIRAFSSNPDYTYIYFGKSGGWISTYDMNDSNHFNATVGARIRSGSSGSAGVYLGTTGVGDLTGDGRADISSLAGASQVYFGRAAGTWLADLSMSTATNYNGTNGARFLNAGRETIVRDLNGDGKMDILFGGNASYTHIYFGKATPWTNITDMSVSSNYNGTNGVRFSSTSAGSTFGYAVGSGDLNGNGIKDYIVSAAAADPLSRSDAGTVFVYFGVTSGWPSSTFDMDGL